MRSFIPALCLLFFAATNARGGDSRVTTATTLENAHEAYALRYADAPPGVYMTGEVLFVVSEFAVDGRADNALKARALFAFRDALRDYAAEKYAPANAPRPPVLLTAFPGLTPLLRTVDPELGVFPLNYEGPSRILVNEKRRNAYRFVVALPRERLEASLPAVRHAVPDAPAVERALQSLWMRLEKEGRLAALCDVLSLPEDRLRLANNELRRHLNADSLCWGAVSPHQLYTAHVRMAALGERPSLEALRTAAGVAPVSAHAMAAWSVAGDAPPWSALNAYLLAMLDEGVGNFAPGRLTKSVNGPLAEYAAWTSKLAARPWPELFPETPPGPAALAAWRTLGHANFPLNAPDAETPEYLEARNLYDEGRELSRLAVLLLQAVEASPRHAASWALLGDTLRASGAHEDSFWPLTQALRLAPENADARASLALAYQSTGSTEWAAGMAASVLAQSCPSVWSRRNAFEILGLYANKIN